MGAGLESETFTKLAWTTTLSGNEQSQRNDVDGNSKEDRVGLEFVDVPNHLSTSMTGATLSLSNALYD